MKHLKRYLSILFAVTIVALSVNMIMAPHNVAAGGLTGLSIILESWLNVDRTIVIYTGQVIMVGAAFIFLGKEIALNTALGAFLLPTMIGIIPRIDLVQDRMLAMIAGSVISGVAACIMYSNKASTGGTALPPLIFKKYFGMRPSTGVLLCDGIIVGLALFVFDTDSFLFALYSIFITKMVMAYIENGLSKKKRVQISSPKNDLIIKDVIEKLGRTVTIFQAIGGFTGESKPVIQVLISSEQYKELIEIVDTHDNKAFMVTDVVSDVHGKGFTFGADSI